MRGSIKRLFAVCAMGIAVTAFSGAASARAPAPVGPGTPQVQQQRQQIAHGRHFRRGPPAYFRHHHFKRHLHRYGRQRYAPPRYFRGPRFHSGFNLVLRFGDNDMRAPSRGQTLLEAIIGSRLAVAKAIIRPRC